MFPSALIAVTALVAVASAQNTTVEPTGNTTYFYGDDGALQIDPNVVDSSLRSAWCTGQQNNCPKVCGGQVAAGGNKCEDTTLDWTCTCSDGSTPNITDYAEMIPSYVCERWIDLCVMAHPDQRTPQQECRSITCGEKNASEADAGSSSSSSSAPASSQTPSSTSGSGSASESSPTSSSTPSDTGAAAALNVAQAYGSSIFAAGLLGIFGLAL
ncbi:uncharacterized protein RCC_04081 [Ramularia collo-cygni]|uniref:DUF7707 domain-containing protein n=1 Tax=Ramularia collo-cygni TaxID=112498 RepID=A0A2D3V3W9_9PEZI|nr:uncharacterized protein RCC_04081 [Ramularia collo-cygni]CZT18236.1 uncharacterized protein RCC_04081 [Ramularia collo-cygni]